MTKYSLNNRKAEGYLICMTIIGGKYNGILPEKRIPLKAIPDLGPKKVAVTLTGVGLYDRVGLGPGADRHVLRCYNPIMVAGGFSTSSIKLVEEMCQFIAGHPGVDAK